MGINEVMVQRIRQLCREREITPNRLSYLAAVPQATIKSILAGESKNVGIITVKKLCDGLGISVVEFFDTEEFRRLDQEIM